jgi:hypothetical protein
MLGRRANSGWGREQRSRRMRAEREKTARIRAESSDADRMRQVIYLLQQILLNSTVFAAFRVKGALFQLVDFLLHRSSPTRSSKLGLERTAANSLTRYYREAVANLLILFTNRLIQRSCS